MKDRLKQEIQIGKFVKFNQWSSRWINKDGHNLYAIGKVIKLLSPPKAPRDEIYLKTQNTTVWRSAEEVEIISDEDAMIYMLEQ